MLITYKLISIFLLVVFDNNNLFSSNAISNSDPSVYKECDFFRYIYGCEHNEGSDCINGRCICKDGYTVNLVYGYCPKTIGDQCISSSECNQTDTNSACFASNDHFSQWTCQCKQDYYYDQNHTNKCLLQLNYGQKCNTSQQCLGDFRICSTDGVCVCDQHFNYDAILKDCKHINNTGCSLGQQWNKFTKKCELKIHYSNKGGIIRLTSYILL